MNAGTLTLPEMQVRVLFEKVAAVTKQSTPELIRDVMRLWCQDLIRETHPKRRTQMTRRIGEETGRLFAPIEDFKSASLQAAFARGADFDIRGGTLQMRPKMQVAEMAEIRQRKRTNKRGRVPMNAGPRAIVAGKVLRQHVAKVKRRIGRLKAGWRISADWARVTVPAWVAYHGSAEGSFKDGLRVEDLSGNLVATNAVPYAGQAMGADWMDLLARKRASDLANGFYAKRWQKKMERALK